MYDRFAGRFLMCCALALGGWAAAAPDSLHLIPLDSRPATRVLPAAIAGLRGGDVQVVPAEQLGTAGRGADPQALLAWLERQAGTGPLVVALDSLAYGGLVQSRTSP
ncbi:DUF4127 family protein [Deinococcus lacus]|uniref:DUF4127 family protein n=1 Tax=Deinococcus lacus TaxID=392561 RepID=A0ABW1Y9M7_9DEIO